MRYYDGCYITDDMYNVCINMHMLYAQSPPIKSGAEISF